MSVYVDDARIQYGRMVMCHMMADTSEELTGMARKIGVSTRWIQHKGTPNEHFDVSLSKRGIAIRAGALDVGMREIANLMSRKRKEP